MRCGGRETKASKASARNPKICIRGLLYPIPRGGGQAVSAGAPRNSSGSEGSVYRPIRRTSSAVTSGRSFNSPDAKQRSFELVQLLDNGRALWRTWLPSVNFLKRTTSTSSWFENEIRVCKPRRRPLCVQPTFVVLARHMSWANGRTLWRAWVPSIKFLEWTTSISS